MSEEVTRILSRLEEGDPQASEELLPLVYDELRRLAQARMSSERSDHTLQATALVHEAYLRLVGGDASPSWESRGQFFAAAAEAMRRILVDYARRKLSAKRGGDSREFEFNDAAVAIDRRPAEILGLHEALERLEANSPEKAALVKLRIFAGMTGAEAASALGMADSTADRHWAYARAWLQREMQAG